MFTAEISTTDFTLHTCCTARNIVAAVGFSLVFGRCEARMLAGTSTIVFYFVRGFTQSPHGNSKIVPYIRP
jgi:hypothetical protein